ICAAATWLAEDSTLASAAFCSASAVRSSMLAISSPDKLEVRTALSSSPAIPKIKTIRDSLESLCLRVSSFETDVNSAMNSPIHPTPTTAVEAYPNHSHQRMAAFNDATSESVRIILDHKKREERSLMVCFVEVVAVIGLFCNHA